MAKILAVETATEYCSAALWLDGQITERCELAGQRHSTLLLPQCQQLLAEAGVAMSALDAVAFGSGPGSFTGVRIACSVAQGLAFGLDLPVIAISSLLALGRRDDVRVVTCQDARMGEVYYAAWHSTDDGWQAVISPVVCRADETPLPPGEGWLGCGSGFVAYQDQLFARLGQQLTQVQTERFPHALRIAELAADDWRAGRVQDAALVAPLYVRDRVARKICER